MGKYAIAVHGGCGSQDKNMSDAEKQALHDLMAQVVNAGRAILERGGSAIDAVEASVRVMEDDLTFNAGRGGTYNSSGEIELDASIMDGSNYACGAVAGVRTVSNPVSLARAVMEKSRHVFMICGGAEKFAEEMGFPQMPTERGPRKPRANLKRRPRYLSVEKAPSAR